MSWYPCCCGGKVLIWTDNTEFLVGIIDVTAVYTAMGLTVHTASNWSGNLHNYDLIIWPIALSNPSWWNLITNNEWSGRLHITAENGGVFDASIAYVDGLSSLTGISVIDIDIPQGCSFDGTVETDDLTNGLSVFKYADTSYVSGGVILSKTDPASSDPGQNWIARNKPIGSNIDFVIAGDSDHLSDNCSIMSNNDLFFENMWNVPV